MKTTFVIAFALLIFKGANAQGWEWLNPLPQGNFLSSVDFVDANTGYAVGGAGTILKTTDGGENWTILDPGIMASFKSVDFIDANTGYAAGNHSTYGIKILKTTDGGISWIPHLSSPQDERGWLNSIYFIDANNGFAVGSTLLEEGSPGAGLILKTTDGGTNWIYMDVEDSEELQSVYFTDINTGFVLSGGSIHSASAKLFKTVDGGLNWTNLFTDLNNRYYSMCFPDSVTGYIVGSKGGILKSIDGGENWSALSSGTTAYLSSVDFVDANTGYAVGNDYSAGSGYGYPDVILKTTNGGLDWFHQDQGSSNGLSSVLFSDSQTGYIVGGNGTILHTLNGGKSWISQSASLGDYDSYQSAYFTDSITGYIVGYNYDPPEGIILTTTNGGLTWTDQMVDNSAGLLDVFFTNANTGYAVGNSGTILKTTDAGIHWTDHSVSSDCYLGSVVFTDDITGFAVGGRYPMPEDEFGVVYRTIDGGITWNGTFFNHALRCITFANHDTGYAVGLGGTVLKTTDGGENWTRLNSGYTFDLWSVDFTDANTGYAISNDNGSLLLRTSDGGNSWTIDILDPGYLWIVSLYFASPNTGYILGYDFLNYTGLMLKTINGGSDWTTQKVPTPGYLNSIFFPDENTGYVVGDNGVILKTTNGSELGLFDVPQVSQMLTIFPNPVKDKFIVESSSILTHAELTLFSINGQAILTKRTTNDKTELDISMLPPGVYFVQIKSDRSIEKGKIIKY